MSPEPLEDFGPDVNLPRRMPKSPASRYDKLLMSGRLGHEAKKGYPEHKTITYGDRCKFCRGTGSEWSVVTRSLRPCSACQ